MAGYIQIHRKLLEWEWYANIPVRLTFIHLLLIANWEPKKWQGKTIQRGQVVIGRDKTSKEIGISEQQFRTSLKKLKSTNEITTKPTNKYTVVTIVKYDDYQDVKSKSTNNLTNNQPSNNQQSTTTKEDNNIIIKEDNKKEKFNFRKALIQEGFQENLIVDWLTVRKTKKLTNTQTAFKKFLKEVEKSNEDKNQVLKICVEHSWGGFNHQWLQNIKINKNATNTNPIKKAATYNREEAISNLQKQYHSGS